MPGGLTRLGPAKESGETRSDQTGNVQARDLDKQGRMADHREGEPVSGNPRLGHCRPERTRPGGRPFRAATAQLPSEQMDKGAWRLAAGIEKDAAVEMIRHGSFEIGIAPERLPRARYRFC